MVDTDLGLAAAPSDQARRVLLVIGGGIAAYIYGGDTQRRIGIEATLNGVDSLTVLKHSLHLVDFQQSVYVDEESIYKGTLGSTSERTEMVYDVKDGQPFIANIIGAESLLGLKLDRSKSVLFQFKPGSSLRDYHAVQDLYGRIRLYRDWTFGPELDMRKSQSSDQPSEVLSDNLDNLFLVLKQLDFEPEARARFLKLLRDLLPEVDDFVLDFRGSTVQLYFLEGRTRVPASRLSDGTLRWLCLLAILVAPAPPSVVVLEEPELGLHPDMINTLAGLLKDAAERMQLVVTTHSDILIDALSDVPDSILVVEKEDEGTKVRRLDPEEMKPWLEKYRLGRLWMMGQIGGTRW